MRMSNFIQIIGGLGLILSYSIEDLFNSCLFYPISIISFIIFVIGTFMFVFNIED